MGLLVTTWGQHRTAIGNGDTGFSYTSGANNLEWSSGFYTTEGNGFVRLDPLARLTFTATYVEFTSGSVFRLKDATSYIVMDQAEADELIGENVELTGPGTFAITSDYLTSGGQSVTTTGYVPITSIGLLTAF
jgi:hypothetical protein